MKTPAFLLGATLVFWGWQTGQVVVGVLLAVVLEGIRWLQWQWELDEKDYFHINDLCSILFVGSFIYFYTAEDPVSFVLTFLRWLPLMFLPMIAAQWFGPRERFGYRTLSWLIRRKLKSEPADSGFNLSYPYFALCLLATSTANPQNLTFFFGFCGLLAWALWAHRPRCFPFWVWSMLLAGIFIAGGVLQHKLHQWQAVVEGHLSNWLWGGQSVDTSENRTFLGQVGKLKSSQRIVLRLVQDRGGPPPTLLRQASYHNYEKETWRGITKDFTAVPTAGQDVWNLLPQTKTNGVVTIGGYLKQGKGVLALPYGTAQIQHFPAQEMEYNPLGMVRVPQGPGFFNFQARYGPGAAIDSPPGIEDRQMPMIESTAIARVAAELRLHEKSFPEVLQAIERFFLNNFSYTTDLKARPATSHQQPTPLGRVLWPTPLGYFLMEERAGHCEYFATATVLLLRLAGYPARYATGYSVQESPRKNRYVVRERHAHAWCLAFNPDKGLWEDFDTTPASWNALEARNASWLQPLWDFWSGLWFEFTRWRYGQSRYRSYIVLILVPLALVLVWRILFKKSKTQKKETRQRVPSKQVFAGMDSEWYQIETELNRAGLQRHPGETLQQWFVRVSAHEGQAHSWLPLHSILQLHYRYRFDPLGLKDQERVRLKSEAEAWLTQSKGQLAPTVRSDHLTVETFG